MNKYTLNLSCADVKGIVSAVSGFLSSEDCFILESAQFGDEHTGRFFMRTRFTAGAKTPDQAGLMERFSKNVAVPFNMVWQLHDSTRKQRVLVLVSKTAHCLNSLLHNYNTRWLDIEIPAIVSNHDTLKGLAEFYNIPFHHLPITPESKAAQEEHIVKLVDELRIDLVVLARYMQILSDKTIRKLYGRVINIHHSFLPSFKGARPYAQAYERGVKIIGATAHYASEALDEGPIIEQEVIRVNHSMSPEELAAKGSDIESLVLSRAIKLHTEHRVLLNGNKTVVFE